MSWQAEAYETYVAPLTVKFANHLLKSILNLVPPPRSISILDVCCGTGVAHDNFRGIAGEGGRYVGVDVDKSMVEYAKEHRGVNAFMANVTNMKDVFDDGAFDAAFSNMGVIFANDVGAGIREMARVVKSNGGVVSISVWAEPKCTEVFEMFGRALEEVTGTRRVKGRCGVDVVVREMMRAGLRDVKKQKVSRQARPSSLKGDYSTQ